MSADLETTPSDSEPRELTSKYARLSTTDIRVVLEMSAGGYAQTEIAAVVGCAQSTVSDTLKAFKDDGKAVAIRLRALTDEAIEDWRKAKRVAAERGDHRPSKELVEMAHPELRSQGGNGAGGGVTVYVAVPGANNPRPVINVTPKLADLSPQLSDDLHRLSGDK
jgi:hypothetical protein